MHIDRPKLAIHLIAFALLVALPATTALGDDESGPGVIQISDTAPAPAPIPIPDAASSAPAPGGPRAFDMPAAPRQGVRRGPYVGGQAPAAMMMPPAVSAGTDCRDCCRDGKCEDCRCEPSCEECCSEGNCCCKGDCENARPQRAGLVRLKVIGHRGRRHRDDDYEPECESESHCAQWWETQKSMFHARVHHNCEYWKGLLGGCLTDGRTAQCKFGYFIPSGCGGGGCQPFGHYSMVYPLNPHYVDRRDAGIFSAQGYGVPVTVPLAPNVQQTYNYSWGIPSSRLTPISRTVW